VLLYRVLKEGCRFMTLHLEGGIFILMRLTFVHVWLVSPDPAVVAVLASAFVLLVPSELFAWLLS
jgi:hypothetical protein